MKYTVKVEIPGGKYCRDAGGNVCDFFWESEDGDTGCCLLGKSTFIEGDISNVPKFDNCPSRQLRTNRRKSRKARDSTIIDGGKIDYDTQ